MTNYAIVILIPIYGEIDNLPYILSNFEKINRGNVDYKLLFIINGNDGSKEYIEKVKTEDKILDIDYLYLGSYKYGIGQAYIDGFKYLKSSTNYDHIDAIVTMDADGSHDMGIIPFMYKLLSGYDMTVGSRYKNGGYRYQDTGSYLDIKCRISYIWNKLFFVLAGDNIADKTAGFRMWKKKYLHILIDNRCPTNFTYNFYTYFLFRKAGLKIVEYPIIFYNRRQGKSKFNFLQGVKDYLHIFYKLIKNKLLFI